MPRVLLAALLLAGCQRITEAEKPETRQVDTLENLVKSLPDDAPIPPNPESSTSQRLQATGTEPFWSIEVQEGRLLYTSPEQQTPVAIPYHLEGLSKNGEGPLVFVGVMAGKRLTLEIATGQCSDGMSDTVYPMRATFTWGERTEHGCARPR